jgi:Tol biopolymer transport system component
MKRSWIATAAVVLASLVLVACAEDAPKASEPTGPDTAQSTEPGGQIVFMRGNPSEGVLAGEGVTYIVNADGSDERQLFSDGPSSGPSWSPDGDQIHIFCCDDGMVAHLLDPGTGQLRAIPPPDPMLEIFCGGAWSPDGTRLACEGFGVDDPNDNGIYAIRISEGGDLSRITTFAGGYDSPGDYSPEGDRLVFVRVPDDEKVGIFVVDLSGNEIDRISPPGVVVDDLFGGSWSPTDDRILFVARNTEEHHKAIWVVNPDGSAPHRLQIASGCGGPLSDPESFGCYSPSWSPDGQWIVFVRSAPDGSEENLWIVNADGSGLVQLTDGGTDDQPDWGPDPAR